MFPKSGAPMETDAYSRALHLTYLSGSPARVPSLQVPFTELPNRQTPHLHGPQITGWMLTTMCYGASTVNKHTPNIECELSIFLSYIREFPGSAAGPESNYLYSCCLWVFTADDLTLILPRSRTGTVWFYTFTSNKRAARPKLYTKSLTRDLKLMYSRFTLVRISINL